MTARRALVAVAHTALGAAVGVLWAAVANGVSGVAVGAFLALVAAWTGQFAYEIGRTIAEAIAERRR